MMKVIIVALLLIACNVFCAYGQLPNIATSFNQTIFVNTTATTYPLIYAPGVGNAMDVTVSSSNAVAGSSNVIVSTVATLPNVGFNGQAAINGGFPAGYSTFASGQLSLSTYTGAALYVYVSSDISGTANVTLSIGALVTGSVNTSILVNFRPLTFDARSNTYYELPANQYTSTTAGIRIYTNVSLYLIFAIVNPTPVILNLANNAIVSANIVANRSASFAIAEGTRTALYIYNVSAEAGTLTVSVATNVTTSTVAAGLGLISSFYRFTHSAGGSAVHSAQLTYDASQSGFTLNANLIANLAWYLYENGAWAKQQSSVSGSVVTSVAAHFSDWSVQSSNSTASVTSNNGGSTTGSASSLNSFFGGFLKCLF